MATDNDRQTRWGCPDGTTACWLEVDLGVPTQFGSVGLYELADRIRRFTLEYRNGMVHMAFFSANGTGKKDADGHMAGVNRRASYRRNSQ